MLPGLSFPSVRDHDLRWIWHDSPAFNTYRGDAWMKEPCRSCPEKVKDYGGWPGPGHPINGGAAHAGPGCDKSPSPGVVLDSGGRAPELGGGGGQPPPFFLEDAESPRPPRTKQPP